MKKHWIWVLVALLAVSWGGNLWFYESEKLEEPIFIKHYYEMPADSLTYMRLYYIDNHDSGRKPYQISLDDDLTLRVEHVSTRSERGRLQLNEMVVSPASDRIEDIREPLRFQDATVHYNDGFQNTVSLGNFIIQPDQPKSDLLDFNSGRGSSDGTGSTYYSVEGDLTLASTSHSFPEMLADATEIEINGESAQSGGTFPVTLNKNDNLQVSYTFRFPEDDVRRFHAYQLMIRTYDEQGHVVSVKNVNEQPELYEQDLRSYVSRWGASE